MILTTPFKTTANSMIWLIISFYIVSTSALISDGYYYYATPIISRPFVVDTRYKQYLMSNEKHSVQPSMNSTSDRIEKKVENKRRILVTGGAGFIGSHLVDSLLLDGHTVIVLDNFSTGNRRNLEHWQSERLVVFSHDVINEISPNVDQIYHLASIASPAHYMTNPMKTMETNIFGTVNMLNLAAKQNATLLLASTSEVYGDPLEHPQKESYWGNANPIGPRASYVESKRACETWASIYKRQKKLSIRIARIFNTYGPRMQIDDGRVVSNFIVQALRNETLSIYGHGNQTRSFLYISDLVEGLKALMKSSEQEPTNIGHSEEISINELVKTLDHNFANKKLAIKHLDGIIEDPKRRRPDLKKAQRVLDGWKPKKLLKDGLRETLAYFNDLMQQIKS